MNNFFWSITLTHDLNPLMKVQLSDVVGCFFRTYEECSRFFSMGIYGVKCKLLATEMKICNDKEFVKFSTCHEFIAFALICFIAGMLSFGVLQNQSVGVHWFNYWNIVWLADCINGIQNHSNIQLTVWLTLAGVPDDVHAEVFEKMYHGSVWQFIESQSWYSLVRVV